MQQRQCIQVLFHPGDEYCAQIVAAAMVRSFTASQVRTLRYEDCQATAAVAVLIQPAELDRDRWRQLSAGGHKVIVFGQLGERLSAELGLSCRALLPALSAGAEVVSEPTRPFDASPLAVRYETGIALTGRLASPERFFCRYDFTDEWNNDGYGRITATGGPWSLCRQVSLAGAQLIAAVVDATGRSLAVYASVTDFAQGSVLWFNRPVGPVDGAEWTVVEEFVSGYRHAELVCLPCLDELPAGVAAVVSPRLDCDQAVCTAGELLDLYGDYRIPLSFAVLTGLPLSSADTDLLWRAVHQGGSLHSHSHSHAPDWGGSYESALAELRDSAVWLERQFPGQKFGRTAVSPFHQNPVFAVQAMRDAGYTGFVGGIIHNDPEFLLGRAGKVPLVDGPLVSLSQQCMLHGDCFHRYGNSVQPYIENFQRCRQAGSFFGYLDHPFSAAYQYGWDNETERLAAHETLIRAIRLETGVVWWSLQQCLDYLVLRNQAGVEWQSAATWRPAPTVKLERFAWHWHGRSVIGEMEWDQ